MTCGSRSSRYLTEQLATPIVLTMPVLKSFSMDFHASMCVVLWSRSREPSGSLGKRWWFPAREVRLVMWVFIEPGKEQIDVEYSHNIKK